MRTLSRLCVHASLLLLPSIAVSLGIGAAPLRGTVFSDSGEPLAGAVVRAYVPESRDHVIDRVVAGKERATIADARTDAAGDFLVDLTPDQLFDLEVTSPGFAPRAVKVQGGDESRAVVLSASPSLTGTVRGGGGPIATARIVFFGARGEELAVSTDSEGRFSVADPELWAASAFVTTAGFAPLWIELEQQFAIDFELEKGVSVRGKVVDSKGAGVTGASIRVNDIPFPTTGEGGSFALTHVPSAWNEITAQSGNRIARAPRTTGTLKLTLREGATVRGIVKRGGRKLGGVEVIATGASTVTDASGRYLLPPMLPSEVWITSDPSFRTAGVKKSLRAGVEESVDLNCERGRRIAGRVVDPEGGSVAGATVIALPEMPEEYATMVEAISQARGFPMMETVVTDRSGAFVLHVPEESEQLIAMHPKWVSGRARLGDGQQSASLTIRVSNGVRLLGRVHDRGGKPLEGASLTAIPAVLGSEVPELGLELRDTTHPSTRPDGTFVRVLAPGKHHIQIAKRGFVAKTLSNVEAASDGAALDVQLETGAALTGKIVREGGAGIGGVRIAANNMSLNRETASAADGSFRIDDFSPGAVLLHAWSTDEMISLSRELTVPSARSLVITVPRGMTLSGFVRTDDDGSPVEEFTLSVQYEESSPMERPLAVSTAVSSSDGSFRLDHLPIGTARVGVSANGFMPSKAVTLAIDEGSPLAPLELTLQRGSRVEGIVRDEGGSPVEGVMVTVEPIGEDDESSASMSFARETGDGGSTDADGRFKLDALAPGSRKIGFYKEGYRPRTETLEVTDAGGTIDVILERGNSLRGQVVDEAGKPIESAWLSAMSSSDEPSYGNAQSGADGSFELSGLGTGPFRVTTRKEGYAADDREAVAAGAGPLRVVLRTLATGTVYGSVRGLPAGTFQSRIVSITSDEANAGGPIAMEGTYRVESAPAGTVKASVTITSSRGTWTSAEREITVIANQEQRIDLDVDPGLTVTGKITRGGKPADRASISFNGVDGDQHSVSASAASDGHYEAQGLGTGRYAVRVDTMGRPSYETWATIAPGNTTLDLEIEGALLRGRVVERSSGKPITGAAISLELDDAQLAHSMSGARAKSDAKGQFEIRGLSPGSFIARAEHPDFGQTVVPISIQGGTLQRDFTLERVEGFQVRIVDRLAGNPLGGGIIIVRDLAKRIVFDGDSKVNEDGSYRVPIPPGDYLISVSASDHASQTVRAAGAATVTIPLSRGGTLIVESARADRRAARLIQPDGEEYVLCWCNRIADLRLDGKRTNIEQIAPGSYTLRVLERDGSARDYPVGIVEAESVSVIVD